VDITDIERILGLRRLVYPPRHVIIVRERVVERLNSELVRIYRGIAPKGEKDVIIITPDAIEETVVHEALHKNYGVGEVVAYPLARVLLFTKGWIPLKVRYRLCAECEEFKELHEEYGRKANHYVLT